MTELHNEARAALHTLVASRAEFRPDQFEAIDALVGARRRVLVVQRTGWGKSAVYFVATRLLRDQGAGPTLLISPLLGLMRNQIDAAERGGLRAARITSDNAKEWDGVLDELEADQIDLLLVAPERFANNGFRERALPMIAKRAGLLVVDEAHCISDWGHDFRPDYRRITRVLDGLPSDVPVLCTTATANDRVVNDIVDQLGDDLLVLRGALDRESLALDVVHLPQIAPRLAWLAATLPQLPGTGIVYTLTIADAHRVADWLQTRGIAARAYSGAETNETRVEIEEQLRGNEIKCVVATSALGMGYDKPDLAFVIHFQMPGSAIAYYQQVGRAGRALEHAYAIGLVGNEDRQIQDWFINTAFPDRDKAELVVAMLEDRADWVKLAEIEAAVNLRPTRLMAMLKVLEVEGVVESNGRTYRRTAAAWEYPAERIALVTGQRRAEQERMEEFLHGSGCLMEFLRRELDDPAARPCGRCSHCVGAPLLSHAFDPDVAREAVAFLRDQPIVLSPRAQNADRTKISLDKRAETGRALSLLGDGGWGTAVQEQRNKGAFSDELAVALADLARGAAFEPAPTWVTCVPSWRRPELVSRLAARVAERLELPFVSAVEKVRETASQREMDNSTQQQRNVAGAFAVAAEVPAGPVLLIDDIVDSGWTLTEVAIQLRQSGSGPVFPLVLTQGRSD